MSSDTSDDSFEDDDAKSHDSSSSESGHDDEEDFTAILQEKEALCPAMQIRRDNIERNNAALKKLGFVASNKPSNKASKNATNKATNKAKIIATDYFSSDEDSDEKSGPPFVYKPITGDQRNAVDPRFLARVGNLFADR